MKYKFSWTTQLKILCMFCSIWRWRWRHLIYMYQLWRQRTSSPKNQLLKTTLTHNPTVTSKGKSQKSKTVCVYRKEWEETFPWLYAEMDEKDEKVKMFCRICKRANQKNKFTAAADNLQKKCCCRSQQNTGGKLLFIVFFSFFFSLIFYFVFKQYNLYKLLFSCHQSPHLTNQSALTISWYLAWMSRRQKYTQPQKKRKQW